MAGSKSNYLEDKMLDHVLGGPDYTRPATLYFGLFTAEPNEAGTGTEVTGGSYARVAVTNNATNFPASSGSQKQNGTPVTFVAATADWGTIVAVGVFDASSSGNMLFRAFLGNDAGKLFTATVADVLTAPGHGFANNDIVRVLAVPGGTLPTGLSEGTTYFVISVSGDTFSLSATQGGAAINITAAGAGLVAKIQPQVINTGAQPSFAANSLTFIED